jgi:hypothetical protein
MTMERFFTVEFMAVHLSVVNGMAAAWGSRHSPCSDANQDQSSGKTC